MNLLHRNSVPKHSNFHNILLNFANFWGRANLEKLADKKNRNRQKWRDLFVNSHKQVQPARTIVKIEKRREFVWILCLEQSLKNLFKMLCTVEGLLVLVDKASFRKNFETNFILVERVILQSSFNYHAFVRVFSSPSWWVPFSAVVMKECDGEHREFWAADAAEQSWYKMDFTRGDSKTKSASSILQALSCWFSRLQFSNPSKLVLSKKSKSRIALLVHNAWGFFRWVVASKARALGAAGNVPDPVQKNLWRDFWTRRNKNKSWKLRRWQDGFCKRKF